MEDTYRICCQPPGTLVWRYQHEKTIPHPTIVSLSPQGNAEGRSDTWLLSPPKILKSGDHMSQKLGNLARISPHPPKRDRFLNLFCQEAICLRLKLWPWFSGHRCPMVLRGRGCHFVMVAPPLAIAQNRDCKMIFLWTWKPTFCSSRPHTFVDEQTPKAWQHRAPLVPAQRIRIPFCKAQKLRVAAPRYAK